MGPASLPRCDADTVFLMIEFLWGLLDLVPSLLVFAVIVLAAERIGALGSRWRLPLITGYLLTGFIAGPDVLGILVRQETLDQIDPESVSVLGQFAVVEHLSFINDFALAIIALAAGNELVLKDFRSQFRSIGWVTGCQVISIFCLGGVTMYFLCGVLPRGTLSDSVTAGDFMAISLLVAVILIARSPSSAIAIVRELHAKGPLTSTILGVTVVMDVAVIVLFAISNEFALAAITPDFQFGFGFLGGLVADLGLSLVAGILFWQLLSLGLRWHVSHRLKIPLLLVAGLGVFQLSHGFGDVSFEWFGDHVHLEPLLICMIAGLLVVNLSPHRAEFARLLEEVGPPVYLTFFTLTGASIVLDVITSAYLVACGLCLARLVSLLIGDLVGSTLAGDPPLHRRIGWMGYVTQAGIGIGLARQIGDQFPEWGQQVATILIAVIVINQTLGPPFLKWAIGMAGEIRRRAGSGPEEPQNAFIFGSTSGASMMLAGQLSSRGCQVTLVTLRDPGEAQPEPGAPDDMTDGAAQTGASYVTVSEISRSVLEELGFQAADVVIGLMDDDSNLALCQLNHDRFGVEKVVVRFTEKIEEGRQWHRRGAIVLDPKTSLVTLLEHFVTSPTATSILLGMDPEQDVVEVVVTDTTLVGVPIRDLKLPLEALILSINREGHTIISHGYTELKLGDQLTVVGPPAVLPDAVLYFER